MDYLAGMPMFRALIPFVAGIVLATHFEPSVLVTLGLLVVAILCGWIFRRSGVGDIFICSVLLLLGMFAAAARRGEMDTPQGNILATIRVDEISSQREGRLYGNAIMTSYTLNREAQASRTELRISAPAESNIMAGDFLLLGTELRPYEADSQLIPYERYMLRTGKRADIHISEGEILEYTHHAPLRHVAERRLAMLDLSSDTRPIVEAITLGNKRGITPELRHNYTMGGSAHLLAVSGMHIGYIFLIVNLLMAWCACLHRGNILRCLAVMAAVWCYAMMVGLSPSVVRAAVMFSLLHIGLMTPYYTRSLNILSATAFVMLVLDSSQLFDVGFQLSTIAVLAIMEWAAPLYRMMIPSTPVDTLVKPHYNLAHYIKSASKSLMQRSVIALAVAVVTTLAIMPLVASAFGTISLWSVAIGSLTILLCGIAQAAALLWILMPFDSTSALATWIVEHSVSAMNTINEWCAQSGYLSAEIEFSTELCWICYTIFAAATVVKWGFAKGQKK